MFRVHLRLVQQSREGTVVQYCKVNEKTVKYFNEIAKYTLNTQKFLTQALFSSVIGLD